MAHSVSTPRARRGLLRGVSVLALVGLFTLLLAPLASADQIYNTLDGTADPTLEQIVLSIVDGGATIQVNPTNGDGKNGCNLTSSTTLTVSVTSSDNSVATVSPSSLTFGSCGDVKTVTVTPHNTGTATVSFAQTANTTGATFTFDAAAFRVLVDNVSPTISITTPADGATYTQGDTVPAAYSCADTGGSGLASCTGNVANGAAIDTAAVGPHSFTVNAADNAGNTNGATVNYTVQAPAPTDSTAPVITPDVTGTLGDNGWYTSDVTLTWEITDNESDYTVTDGCENQNITADQNETTYYCSASSDGGSTGPVSVSIKRDGNAPVNISGAPNRGPDHSGWYNAPVLVVFTGEDAFSGVDHCTEETYGDEVADVDGTGRTVDGRCKDNAGNWSDPVPSSTFDYDATAPTGVGGAPNRPADHNGWYNHAVTVEFTGNGGPSGIDSCTSTSYSEPDSTNASVNGSCTDVAGNTGAQVASTGFKYDATAPTISGSAAPAPNGNGWNNTDVDVSFTCNDNLSGVASCGPNQTLNGDGAGQSAIGNAVDNAGNSASDTVSGINIDKTAPGITLVSRLPAANGNGWNNANVTVTWNCSDGGSGVVDATATDTVSTEGENQTAEGTCEDLAGNTVSDTQTGISIDKTNPSVSLVGGPANGASYYFGSVPAAPTCSASDAVSGLDGSCSVSGYSAAVGPQTVSASATDKAGNTNSASAGYTVLGWTLKGFYQPVDMNNVVNTVKAGSTVPLKFEVFAGSTELVSTSVVTSFGATEVSCTALTAGEDAIEMTTTGGTALRYDSTAGQFIQNWQTPKKVGACYRVTVKTQDNSTLVAFFKLK